MNGLNDCRRKLNMLPPDYGLPNSLYRVPTLHLTNQAVADIPVLRSLRIYYLGDGY